MAPADWQASTRFSATSRAASTALRYGTFFMSSLLALSQASNMKALAPVTPAQFSSRGLARKSVASSAIELTADAVGTVMPTKVLETRAIGTRSSGLYGRLSCRNGCAVNADVGDIRRT